EIDIWRAFSSGSASLTVVPSVTVPRRLVAPPWNRSASCSEVFPLPRWPTSATLRMRSAGLCMPVSFLSNAVSGPYRLARSRCERVLFRDAGRSHAVAMGSRLDDESQFTGDGCLWNAKVRLASLAGGQFGRIRYDQMLALGVSGRTIGRWRKTGYLHRELPRVYAVGHPGRSPES